MGPEPAASEWDRRMGHVACDEGGGQRPARATDGVSDLNQYRFDPI